jgi:hypothetical protein
MDRVGGVDEHTQAPGEQAAPDQGVLLIRSFRPDLNRVGGIAVKNRSRPGSSAGTGGSGGTKNGAAWTFMASSPGCLAARLFGRRWQPWAAGLAALRSPKLPER